jgi:hypothetical protein
MIRPRLNMLGADPHRIVTFTEVDCSDSCYGHRHSRPIRVPLDLPMFEYILRQHRGCRLMMRRYWQVRRALTAETGRARPAWATGTILSSRTSGNGAAL